MTYGKISKPMLYKIFVKDKITYESAEELTGIHRQTLRKFVKQWNIPNSDERSRQSV